MRRAIWYAAFLAASLTTAGFANATVIAGCTGTSTVFTCNLLTGDSTVYALPALAQTTAGYVVILDPGNSSLEGFAGSFPGQANQSLWSDVIFFPDDGLGISNHVQLLWDPATFPSYYNVEWYGVPAPNVGIPGFESGYYISAEPGDVTHYIPTDGTFDGIYEHFEYDVYTPEPASVGLMGSGLVGFAWFLRRRRNRRA